MTAVKGGFHIPNPPYPSHIGQVIRAIRDWWWDPPTTESYELDVWNGLLNRSMWEHGLAFGRRLLIHRALIQQTRLLLWYIIEHSCTYSFDNKYILDRIFTELQERSVSHDLYKYIAWSFGELHSRRRGCENVWMRDIEGVLYFFMFLMLERLANPSAYSFSEYQNQGLNRICSVLCCIEELSKCKKGNNLGEKSKLQKSPIIVLVYLLTTYPT